MRLEEFIERLEDLPEETPITFAASSEQGAGNVGGFQEYTAREGQLSLTAIYADGVATRTVGEVLADARELLEEKDGMIGWREDTPLWAGEAGRAQGLALTGFAIQMRSGGHMDDDPESVQILTLDISDYV